MSDKKLLAYDPVTSKYFMINDTEFKKAIDRLDRMFLDDCVLHLDDILNSLPNLNP